MTQYGFYFDQGRCYGCKACSVACKDRNDIAPGPEKCEGDRNCFKACPYGAPKFASDEPGAKMSKCTMCIDRLEKGELPLCVASCPMRALDFGPIDELIEKYGDVRKIETMPEPDLTMPNWIAKPNPPKEQLIPYDAEKAIKLSKTRTATDDVYGDYDNLTNFDESDMAISELRMKNATVAEVMAATSSDQG